MKIEDSERCNFIDMLEVMEDEMQTHIAAGSIVRKGISCLFSELNNMSAYICYLEDILSHLDVDYIKYEDMFSNDF